MAKPFAVGDRVQWKDFYSKGIERGTIGKIDREKILMMIRTGPYSSMSARRVRGKWCAYRAYKGYLERISRVKESS